MISTDEDDIRFTPSHIAAEELAFIFDWLNLSPKAWTKIKANGIPPHIERKMEIRLRVLEYLRQSQKLVTAEKLESHYCAEVYSRDYETTSDYSELVDKGEHWASFSRLSLCTAIEKIGLPTRTRMLITAMLEDIRVPSIDCDPIESYRIYDALVAYICSHSGENSTAAKDLSFCLLLDARNSRRARKLEIALELEFLASAIDLITYRKYKRPIYAQSLWF